MKNFKILFILLMAIGTLNATAQNNTGEIKGKVFDKEDGTALPGAVAYVEAGGSKITAVTDVNGNFTIKPLRPGIYAVTITFSGMQSVEMPNISVNPDQITFLDKTLLAQGNGTQNLKTIVVQGAAGGLINPEETSRKTLTAKQIKTVAVLKQPGDFFASLSSDIQKGADDELYFRGSRSSSVAYIVDGVKLGNTMANVPSSAIGSVTVYTGGIPAKYGDVTGGVIILETKSYFDLYNQRKAQADYKP